MRFLSSLFLTALYATATVNAQSDPPTQVHLAYAGKQQDGMTVSWATTTSQASTLCNYGTQQGGPYTFNATGSAPIQHKCFFYTSPYLHNVKLTGLTPNTKYYYVCGDQTNGLSAEGAFTSAAPVNPNGPYTMAIIGDLGQTKDSQSTVTNLVSNGAFGHVFIVGDLSYADMDGNRWDSWGKMMTPLTTHFSLMSTAGNHEEEILCTGGTFAAYIARMNMPYQESGSTSNMWYSYEVANLHIISFSSYSSYDENSAQYAWIQQDLQKIDRTKTPWVVVMQHTPWYNSNQHHQGEGDDIQQTYEQMFYNAGVDLVFSGHVHAYERSKKVYNQNEDAKGIIHITIGDGGNREGLAEPWNDPQPDWSAFRQAAFGYGMLTTANATHALWEWHRDEDDIKIITDSVWIVKGQLNVVENYRPMIMPQTQWKKWNSAMW